MVTKRRYTSVCLFSQHKFMLEYLAGMFKVSRSEIMRKSIELMFYVCKTLESRGKDPWKVKDVSKLLKLLTE